jgi:ABC-type multidrug transport system ATPase subunit
MNGIIFTEKLNKNYDKTRAINNLELRVNEGEIFGLEKPQLFAF